MNPEDIEVRSGDGVEIRAAQKEGFLGTLVGYAAVFNSESRQLQVRGVPFTESISPGAFKDTLESGAEVFAFNQHDRHEVLARRSAGTLRLEEDTRGLRVEIDLVDTQRSRDLLTDVKAGNIRSMSFGMPAKSIRDAWTMRDGMARRTIRSASLKEVSAVTEPAYDATELTARSFDTFRKETSASQSAVSALRARVELAKLT